MVTSMVACDEIINGITDKTELWSVNTEKEYHEIKSDDDKKADDAEKTDKTKTDKTDKTDKTKGE